MSWDIVVKIGEGDTFVPSNPGEATLNISFDRPGDTWLPQESVLSKIYETYGSSPGDAAVDLLRAAIAVYSADKIVSRKYASDGWTRDFNIYLPVSSLSHWQESAPIFVEMLSFLSGDRWNVHFRTHSSNRENKPQVVDNSPDLVALFSGGIDSLVGVIDLLSEGKKIALVSHYDKGSIHNCQIDVLNCINKVYSGQVTSSQYYVMPPRIPKVERGPGNEPSSRSRSFLFFALGIATADAVGKNIPLYVAENGLISLNVPLTPSRIGSCSTRTTHPQYVNLFRKVLHTLGLDHSLILNYRFKTKGEMLRECANQELLSKALPESMSCAHPDTRRLNSMTPGEHCGYCFPCIIRQAAIYKSGLPDSAYDYDIHHLEPKPSSKRGKDLKAMQIALDRFEQRGQNKAVFDVLNSGSIPPDELSQYVDVYCRGMREIGDFLGRNSRG
jgi:hypothetical protein